MCVCVCVCVCACVFSRAWLFTTPWTIYRSPDFSVHGIFQARILEWVAISFTRGSSLPRDQTHVSCTGRQILSPLHHLGSPLNLGSKIFIFFYRIFPGVKCTIQWTNRIGYFDCWRIFHWEIRLQLHSSESFHFQNKVKTPKGMFTLRV